jgi:tetratricopeptide (TPR) repeat protein
MCKQLQEDIQTFRRDLMPINVMEPIKRKTKFLIQEAFNIDEYSIIWLQDHNESSTTIDTSLISNIIHSLKIFFSLNQCVDYIQSLNKNAQIYLISSHPKSEKIVEEVSNYTQIIAIYILWTQSEPLKILPSSNLKLRGYFSNIRTLTDALSQEHESRLKSTQIPISVFHREKNGKTVRDLSKENVRFLWFQLVIDVLIKIPYNDQAKDDMLDECRKHYGIPCHDDEPMEEKTINQYDKNAEQGINDFDQNYLPNEALQFYTKDSFLYRLFNQALRIENIDLLFIFRFFLADMYKHLQRLYLEQFSNDILPDTTVFRGQLMTSEEFHSLKDNIGCLISINTFFSTTVDRSVAEPFSGCGEDPNFLSVLFEIDVSIANSTIKRPFAYIGHISTKPDELEVVFSVGSMFRIEDIEDRRSNEGYWYVRLKLVEDDNETKEFRDELENEFLNETDLCSLGAVLMMMGDYKRAERHFHMLLEYSPADHPNTYHIYSYLGKLAHNQGDYQTSIHYHEKALEYLTKPNIYNTRDNIGQVYADTGASYHRLGHLDAALQYLTMAKNMQNSPKLLSHTYNQLALVYRNKCENHLALEYFLKALHIDEEILKINQYQPALATAYNNIGEIYSQLGDYDRALKFLDKALYIRLKGTVSTHTDLAAIYNNLGYVHYKKNQPEKALEVFEKALEIDTQALGDHHESLALTHNNISAIYRDMNDLSRALHHLETALRILLRSQAGENHFDVAAIQYNIGVLQLTLGNHTKALKMAQKALQNQLRLLPENHERLAHTYVLLSHIYQNQKNKTMALEYIEKAVEVARISILPHNPVQFEAFQSQFDLLKNDSSYHDDQSPQIHVEFVESPNNLDLQHCLISNYDEELRHLSPDDIVQRLKLLHQIGSIYSKKENYSMAMKYFNEAIELYLENSTSTRFCSLELETSIMAVYFSMSRVYYRQNNWTMSLHYLEKMHEFALKQTRAPEVLAEIYHCMGLSYKHQLDISMALYYLEMAVSTAKEVWPDDHPRVQVYDYNLQQLKLLP